jgi:predicted transcriptional regulator
MASDRRRRDAPTEPPRFQPPGDAPLYGEVGVLAYDEVADRMQCHACGRFFHKLTAGHLARHRLSIAGYKELYGLNMGTALETPRITELRRQNVARHGLERNLVPAPPGHPRLGLTQGHAPCAESLRKHHTPEALHARRLHQRRWTDEDMLTALRDLQAERGGVLTCADLAGTCPPGGPRRPGLSAVVQRFGSWQQVCELLGQPYRPKRVVGEQLGVPRRWSDEAIIRQLRVLQERCGGVLTAADLERHADGHKGKPGEFPSAATVYQRIGPWPRVCVVLGQPVPPPRRASPPPTGDPVAAAEPEAPRAERARLSRRRSPVHAPEAVVGADRVFGEVGVLAYDEVEERIQCHTCGGFYHKLTDGHVRRHGLSVPEYKERYGLNDSTPLETPRLTALRRRQALARDAGRYLVTGANPAAAGRSVWQGRKQRAQYHREHQTPRDRQANSRRQQRWTDEGMLAALRRLQGSVRNPYRANPATDRVSYFRRERR